MKDKIKIILALIGIILLVLFITFITIIKYCVKPTTLPIIKNGEASKQKTNQEIRKIDNIQDINENNFSLKNIKITLNDNYLQITGILKNNTSTEQSFTLNSTVYSEKKYQLQTKDTTLDTKIQPNDEIPIFINHYYDEFKITYSNINYYKINILN